MGSGWAVTTAAVEGIAHVVVAHGPSTAKDADEIVTSGSVEGTSTASTGNAILERGSHDELVTVEGGFYGASVGVGEKNESGDGTMGSSDSAVDLVSKQKAIAVDVKTADVEVKLEEKQKEELPQGYWRNRGRSTLSDIRAPRFPA